MHCRRRTLRTLRARPAPLSLRTAPSPGSPLRTIWPRTPAPSAVSAPCAPIRLRTPHPRRAAPRTPVGHLLPSRRAQELLLESARRELAACDEDEERSSFIEGELQRAQKLGEESRKFLAARSLADLGKVRATAVTLTLALTLSLTPTLTLTLARTLT